jgi:hypothetical protein
MTQTNNDSSTSSVPPSSSTKVPFADQPLSALLGLSLADMSPEELRQYTTHLRAMRTNAPTLEKAIAKDAPKKAKASKSKASKDSGKSKEALVNEYGD